MSELQDCIDNRFGSPLDILARQEHFINIDVPTNVIVQYLRDHYELSDKQIIEVLLIFEDGLYKAEYQYEDYMDREHLTIKIAGMTIEL